MFSYSVQHWATFLAAAFLLNMSPGPDMAYILANTVRGGRRSGFAAMLGIWTGAMGHVAFAAVGLSALLVASATAFSVVKYAGAAYLAWLGIQALRSRGAFSLEEAGPSRATTSGIFAHGMLVNLLNPKVAIFFLAFLPQFVVPGAGPVSAQLALHGVLLIASSVFVEPPLVLLGDRISNGLRGNVRFRQWLDRGLGAFLILIGLRLAVSER
ncbi:threonine/homoserine/homoserine lactone efflux protein [Desulfobaculum xiamenense]|uniref:Threonine/homoserine/homoserine lactone efflux protein n=1 Tax=Desulfobaculum xiamenense TaxID=995050 RepID=A0A846QQ70_9BACT|nr:LysE family translocator [Desulfobaculum xiamenense]NJB69130.1 threonine/homoserine/homoserine lactone efflux protein [Desulfobaculum xiamenense]